MMKPHTGRKVSFIVALLFAMPLPFGVMTGFYLWLSPYLFLNSVLTLHQVVAFNIFAIVLLLAVVWKHRLFCHWICPTGFLCDVASRRGRKTKWLQRIPPIHKLVCVLALVFAIVQIPILIWVDPINLFYAFFDGFYGIESSSLIFKFSGLGAVVALNFFIAHIWCQRLCPLGGMQDLLFDLKQWMMKQANLLNRPLEHKRRIVVGGVLSAGLALVLKQVSHAQSGEVLRPPGSQPESLFKTLCARCGNCMKACPTNIIVPSLQVEDPLSALTPQIRFQTTYCTPECTQCGTVCPSGAINHFSVDEKARWVIGLAVIHTADCLLTQNKECDLCKTYCPYDAIAIQESEFDFSAYPEVLHEQCVGCGACEIVCPVNVIQIKHVKSVLSHDSKPSSEKS